MSARRSVLVFLSLLALLVSLVAGARAGQEARPRPAGRTAKLSVERNLTLQTAAPSGRIVVKFAEESGLRVRDGAIRKTKPDGMPEAMDAGAPEVERLQRLLDRLAVGHGRLLLRPHFSRPAEELDAERRQAERRAGRAMPDLNGYARIVPAASLSRGELLEIVAELSADPAVEAAFLEPVAVPASIGFDAFTGRYDEAAAALAAGDLRTPDFTNLQGYLDPAPLGVNAEGVWSIAGGRGQTVKVLDIEGAWLWEHEDLTAPFFTAGGAMPDLSWRNHGTAVMGEIRGTSNAYGVTGIANQVQIGGVSVAELSIADAINTASAQLDPGDIFVIELHAPGPNATGEGQFGYVCMEFWLDNFEAIQIATASGRICCEAAGNGSQNFDDPVYGDLFDRETRDSGAILCGASNGSSLEPAGFSNNGARVDLHGWGYNVTTCAYGNLQGGAETQWYTGTFSGTSSATPIVAGSVASLQGMVKAAFGIPLNARLARDILVETGTPQTGSAHIGPRPNLTAAWTEAQAGIGRVAGTVTDAGTGQPLADVGIAVAETGRIRNSNCVLRT